MPAIRLTQRRVWKTIGDATTLTEVEAAPLIGC